MSEMTNPAEPEVMTEELDLGNEENEAFDESTEEVEQSDDQAEAQTEEEELEEVERDGKKYRVPKALAGELLMQADYTRKTQAHAEEVRQFKAAAQAEAQRIQLQQANLQGYAQLHAIDAQLHEFGKIDWNAATDANPQQAQKAWMQFQHLQQQRSGLAQHLQQQEQTLAEASRAEREQRVVQAYTTLKAEIPDLEKVLPELNTYAAKAYGYTAEELQAVDDPRAIKILNKARLYDQLMAKTKQQQQAKKPELTPVKAISGKTSQPKPPSKMSDAEWFAHEQAKLRRQAKA